MQLWPLTSWNNLRATIYAFGYNWSMIETLHFCLKLTSKIEFSPSDHHSHKMVESLAEKSTWLWFGRDIRSYNWLMCYLHYGPNEGTRVCWLWAPLQQVLFTLENQFSLPWFLLIGRKKGSGRLYPNFWWYIISRNQSLSTGFLGSM